MSIMNFTTEEINIIAIYKADTLAATLVGLDEALTNLLDEDMINIAETARHKLAMLNDLDYTDISFIPADETDE